MKINTLLWKP